MLDIRPRVSDYTVTVGARSPFEFEGRTFNQTGNSNGDVIASDEDLFISSMSYYQGRIDKVFLNKNGEFQLVQGTPSDDPQAPKQIDDSIEIATIELPPYLYEVDQHLLLSISIRDIECKTFVNLSKELLIWKRGFFKSS